MISPDGDERRRVLALGDSGTCASGFGTVMRNLLKGLAQTGRYEIDHLGINYHGDYYDRSDFDYRIYPAWPRGDNDLYGRERLMRALQGRDNALSGPWDILFTLQDHFILEPVTPKILGIGEALSKQGFPLSWVGYWPIDGPLKERWVREAIVKPDISAVYTQYGLQEVLRHDPNGEFGYREKVKVIPHGVDVDSFHPLSDADAAAFRRNYFGHVLKPGDFLVTNVNRNQWRKDLPRTMAAFARFHKRVPASFLYLHAAAQDAGGDLGQIARHFGLTLGVDWGCPSNFDVNAGVSREQLNGIYNVSDLIVSTSLGEGWGLSLTEAMAAGVPVMAPHHTSIPEIFGNDTVDDEVRGISVRCGGDSQWVCGGATDLDQLRPLTDIGHLASRIEYAHGNRARIARMAEDAQRWVQGLRWERVLRDYWLPLFRVAEVLARATLQDGKPTISR